MLTKSSVDQRVYQERQGTSWTLISLLEKATKTGWVGEHPAGGRDSETLPGCHVSAHPICALLWYSRSSSKQSGADSSSPSEQFLHWWSIDNKYFCCPKFIPCFSDHSSPNSCSCGNTVRQGTLALLWPRREHRTQAQSSRYSLSQATAILTIWRKTDRKQLELLDPNDDILKSPSTNYLHRWNCTGFYLLQNWVVPLCLDFYWSFIFFPFLKKTFFRSSLIPENLLICFPLTVKTKVRLLTMV